MTEQELAAKIVELIGGTENISTVRHCATRLRIVVTDKEKIDSKGVENLDKVKKCPACSSHRKLCIVSPFYKNV